MYCHSIHIKYFYLIIRIQMNVPLQVGGCYSIYLFLNLYYKYPFPIFYFWDCVVLCYPSIMQLSCNNFIEYSSFLSRDVQ